MRTQVSFLELLGFLTRAPGALRRRAENPDGLAIPHAFEVERRAEADERIAVFGGGVRDSKRAASPIAARACPRDCA